MNGVLNTVDWSVLIFAFSITITVPPPMAPVAHAAVAPETRCGRFQTIAFHNAWRIDALGEWTISVQGGPQAEGDCPDFCDARSVTTNVNYGDGCACMKVTTSRADRRSFRIISAYSRAL